MIPNPPKEAIAGFFDEMSGTRNELFRIHPVLDYEQRVRSRTVLQLLSPRADERILDIGCGNARDIIPILVAGSTVVGVDISEGMIEEARRDLRAVGYHDVELEVGDATRLKYPDRSFDKILCSEVVEHIPAAAQAILEMCRVLKPGGLLVISTPNRRSWYGFDRYVVCQSLLRRKWNHPFDNWRTMAELSSLLDRHGFQIETRQTVCYMPGFLLTYKLPWKGAQKAIVALTRRSERLLSRVLPANGYLLAVSARRKES